MGFGVARERSESRSYVAQAGSWPASYSYAAAPIQTARRSSGLKMERTGRQRALLDVTGPHTSYCFGPGGAGIGGCGAWTYCMYSRALRAFWSSVGPAIA